MSREVTFSEERAELKALLETGIFARSPNLAQFLKYVCEKYFAGELDQIREYNIAVEALGRRVDFDQKRDSIVRVEAHRLRKRLSEYYAGEGATRPVWIYFEPGSYVPQFRRTEIPSAPAAALPAIHPNRRWLRIAGIAVLLAAGVAGVLELRRSQAPPVAATAPPAQTVVAQALDEIRLVAGARDAFTDRCGKLWSADSYFSGGQTFRIQPRPILRALDPALFFTRREGNFRYDIPLKPGVYELRLYFAEVVYGENNVAGGGETSRMFGVMLNGKQLIDVLDVTSDAGGSNMGNVKVFKDIRAAEDGYLRLAFTSYERDKAFVNAIEILPGIPGKTHPVRIVPRETPLVDRAGRAWYPDRFFNGGQLVRRNEAVADTSEPELYGSERFGHFSYAIPVAQNGLYGVTLKFCEQFFGPGRPGKGGVGSRVFDLYCNGRTLLRRFDLIKEAGPLRAVERTFHGLEPSAQGKLLLTFVPVTNYPLVNAIEVADESK